MKSWDSVTADVTKLMDKHYTAGRGGTKINKIVLHHNGGKLTTEGCWQVWQTRKASAHYQVETSGRVGQLVWDRDTAWHAGNWDANQTSIGIEHANSSTPTSPITEATLDNGAHLVAALCKHYGLGRPQWGKNVFGHKSFSSTECPGHIASDQRAAYMARAEHWYDQMTGTKPSTSTSSAKPQPKPKPSTDQLAREVIAGKWGNGAERRRRLGSRYAEVQRRVNELLR